MQIVTNIKTKKVMLIGFQFSLRWALASFSGDQNILIVRHIKSNSCCWKRENSDGFFCFLLFHFACHNHSSTLSNLFSSPHLTQGSIHHSPHLFPAWLMYALDGSQLQNTYIKSEGVLCKSPLLFVLVMFCLHKHSLPLSNACISHTRVVWKIAP